MESGLRLRRRDWVLSVQSLRSSSEAAVARWFRDSIRDGCCLCWPFQCSEYFFHFTTGRARLWSQGPGRCEQWAQAACPGRPCSSSGFTGGAETSRPHFPGKKQAAGRGRSARSPGRRAGRARGRRAVPSWSLAPGRPLPSRVPAAHLAVPGVGGGGAPSGHLWRFLGDFYSVPWQHGGSPRRAALG